MASKRACPTCGAEVTPIVFENPDALRCPICTSDIPIKRKGGFATMDPAKRAEIARRGGVAAHAAGKAHKFSSEEARHAGRLGGLAPKKRIKKEETNDNG